MTAQPLAGERLVELRPGACDDCLRRALFLRLLGPYIELVVADRRGARCAELLRLTDEDLARAVAPAKAGALLARRDRLDPARLRERLDREGMWACCRHDPGFPPALGDIGDAPVALLGRGRQELLTALEPENTVTIVGSRRATAYGRGIAEELAAGLAAAGMTVVSGMANGIDAAAHRGALEAGGGTIAVLGGGPDSAYPHRQRRLYERIAERGLVVSELPPGAATWRWMFPARNRIMAALAAMTVVVEAAERSGSLITAEMASDLGRDVGAVPGPVSSWPSKGANRLLRDGAAVIRDAQDVLDSMLGPGQRLAPNLGAAIDDDLRSVLSLLGDRGAVCDAIAVAAEIGPATAAERLARLELMGYARGDASGRYFRTLLEPPP
ncbi:MAG: processing protein [Solirubrobacterales bacterium]|nr:processing protein [Solirubrobacterales bacterium]